ncbi:hypothetical protein Y032_0003g1582 [Ancylostoma ceylanicum]|uniref:ABC transporter domain-containing protein n=1 Tax=Ancylostoma ceylanicum TaxID=53326 RepID=A0A016VXY1_9BILA|nr:hypothetical protein Y032_0003g1582 [Ancylostoma ceylanicum]
MERQILKFRTFSWESCLIYPFFKFPSLSPIVSLPIVGPTWEENHKFNENAKKSKHNREEQKSRTNTTTNQTINKYIHSQTQNKGRKSSKTVWKCKTYFVAIIVAAVVNRDRRRRVDDSGDGRSLVSTTAATVGRCCRRQLRRSVAGVDDSGDGRSLASTTAATETAILLEEYSGSLRNVRLAYSIILTSKYYPQHRILACMHGFPKPKELAELVLHAVGMVDHADKLIRYYSGGQRRKISVGLALLAPTRIIILDEPTAGIDPKARREIWEVLSMMRDSSESALLLTSHSMDECEALCSRIAILQKGRMIAIGTSQQLKSRFVFRL